MKTFLLPLIIVAFLAANLTGCSNMSRKDKGTVAGAAVGGTIVGVATKSPVGAVAGAVGGGLIGRHMAK